MKRCYFCHTEFSEAGWSAPAEPCDCGANATKADAREMDPDTYAACREHAASVAEENR